MRTIRCPVELGDGLLQLLVDGSELPLYQRVLHIQDGLVDLVVEHDGHIQVLEELAERVALRKDRIGTGGDGAIAAVLLTQVLDLPQQSFKL